MQCSKLLFQLFLYEEEDSLRKLVQTFVPCSSALVSIFSNSEIHLCPALHGESVNGDGVPLLNRGNPE
jgi:hypothetical protein